MPINLERSPVRSILIPLLILFALTGCEDKEAQAKHDAQIAQQAREELLAELEAKKAQEEKEPAAFNKIGINVHEGTIMIDTNKTKNFLNELGKKMDVEMKRMVLKHKETDRMLKKINEKVINNADFF